MKTKKHQLFLWISLAFFALSLVIFFVEIVLLYHEFKTTSSTLLPKDLADFEFAFVIGLYMYISCVSPALLEELSCIRSVYRILKYEPHGAIRICWLISAILSFSALVFQVLVFTGVLDFTKESGSLKLQETVLFLTGLPVVILSFVLGSIRKKSMIDVPLSKDMGD